MIYFQKKLQKEESIEAMEKSKNFDKLIMNYNNVKPNTNGVLDLIKILKSNYVLSLLFYKILLNLLMS